MIFFKILIAALLYGVLWVVSLFFSFIPSLLIRLMGGVAIIVLIVLWRKKGGKKYRFWLAVSVMLLFCLTFIRIPYAKYFIFSGFYEETAEYVTKQISSAEVQGSSKALVEYPLPFPKSLLVVSGKTVFYFIKGGNIAVSFPYDISFFSRHDYLYMPDGEESFDLPEYDRIESIGGGWYSVKWY